MAVFKKKNVELGGSVANELCERALKQKAVAAV